VRLHTGKETMKKEGVLARSIGEIDTTGQTSKVVVVINDPYHLKASSSKGGETERPAMDFEVGAFVEVILPGRELERVFPLAAHLVRSGDTVWVADKEDLLQIRKVKVARRNDKEAFVSGGLIEGERVITTNLSGAIPGLKLRVHQAKATPKEKEGPKTAHRPVPKKAEASQ
jgi:hypothetical protein